MDDVKKDSLTKISDALNTTFESTDLVPVKNEPKEIAVNQQEVEEVFEDQQYLREDLKKLIEDSKVVLGKLGQDIMLGATPRMHEVYATLLDSTVRAYKEISELNKAMFDAKIKKQKLIGGGKSSGGNKSNTVALTAGQLQEIIERARKNSSMNAIEVDFKVSEEDK